MYFAFSGLVRAASAAFILLLCGATCFASGADSDRPYAFTQSLRAGPALSPESTSGAAALRAEATSGGVRIFVGLQFSSLDEDSLSPAAAEQQAR
jgi:hypothetical protein